MPAAQTHTLYSVPMSYIILEHGSTRASVVMKSVLAVLLRASLWCCGPFLCRAEWLPPPGTTGWNLVQVSTGPGIINSAQRIPPVMDTGPSFSLFPLCTSLVFLLPISISLLPHPSIKKLSLSIAKSKPLVLPCLFWSLHTPVYAFESRD